MRMRHLRPNTPCESSIFKCIINLQLFLQSLRCGDGVGVCESVEKAGEVEDVAAGEADEGFAFYEFISKRGY